MQTLSDDSKAFIKEMMKSEGWRIWSEAVNQYANILRREATEQGVELEDRLWKSAYAKGLEAALDTAVIITKK